MANKNSAKQLNLSPAINNLPVSRKNQARAITLVSAMSAVSMFFGYARDIAVVAVFGAASASDAFFAAIIIPVMLGRVILSGALAPALIPVFTNLLPYPAKARAAANTLLTVSCITLLLVALLVMGSSGQLASWLVPGFDQGRTQITSRLLLITAPAIIFLGISAVLGAMLNGLGNYGAAAFGTALVNGCSFLAIPIAGINFGIEGAALGLVVGTLAQVGLLVWTLRRRGWVFQPLLRLDMPEFRQVLGLFWPLLIFMLVDQGVTLTERLIASGFPAGQLSQLSLANKLFQLPGFILASAVATVMFPLLARQSQPNQLPEFLTTLRATLNKTIFLVTPLAIWFIFGSEIIVRLVFQHGEFTSEAARATADLLRLYALAVLPIGLLLVLFRAFYARRQMYLPLIINLGSLMIYLACALGFSWQLGIYGLPLAFALSQSVAVIIALVVLIGQTRAKFGDLFNKETARLVLANGGVIAIGLIWAIFLEPTLSSASWLFQAVVFGLVGLISGLVYLWFGRGIRQNQHEHRN